MLLTTSLSSTATSLSENEPIVGTLISVNSDSISHDGKSSCGKRTSSLSSKSARPLGRDKDKIAAALVLDLDPTKKINICSKKDQVYTRMLENMDHCRDTMDELLRYLKNNKE